MFRVHAGVAGRRCVVAEPAVLLILVLVLLVLLLCAGAGLVWQARRLHVERARHARREQELQVALGESQAGLAALREQLVEARTLLESERSNAKEKLALLEGARERLAEVFKGLSADALSDNNRLFLELAGAKLEKFQQGARYDLEQRQVAITHLLKPMQVSLEKFQQQVGALEKEREGAYQGLSARIQSLLSMGERLRSETDKLSGALSAPTVRGRWGELQLRRTVELAGMQQHCDFDVQLKLPAGERGRHLRPDLVVHFPGGGRVAVDAKVPMDAYLRASDEQDEDRRRELLEEHARRVRGHVRALAKKAYWEQLRPTPDFVVMYLPGEAFYLAALEHDPELLVAGVEQRVFLVGPTALIALLNAVAHAWQEHRLAHNAEQISVLGRELYERIASLAGHWSQLGKHLERTVDSYNKAVGSLEQRVLVSARRFNQLGVTAPGKEVVAPASLETVPRRLQASELQPGTGQAVAEADDGQVVAAGKQMVAEDGQMETEYGQVVAAGEQEEAEYEQAEAEGEQEEAEYEQAEAEDGQEEAEYEQAEADNEQEEADDEPVRPSPFG